MFSFKLLNFILVIHLIFHSTTEGFLHHFNKYSRFHNINNVKTQLKYQNNNNVITSETDSFLKSIISYGENRMARKAIKILEKMVDDELEPSEMHYTATIRACGISDQYKLAYEIYQEMCKNNVPRSLSTYEALIDVAERTDHLSDTFLLFKDLHERDGIHASTEIYNSVLFAAAKLNNFDQAHEIFDEMLKEGVERDLNTYEGI